MALVKSVRSSFATKTSSVCSTSSSSPSVASNVRGVFKIVQTMFWGGGLASRILKVEFHAFAQELAVLEHLKLLHGPQIDDGPVVELEQRGIQDDSMIRKGLLDVDLGLVVVDVKGQDIGESLFDRIVRKPLEMFDDADGLSGGVRIADGPILSEVSELSKGSGEFVNERGIERRTVARENGDLGREVRIVDEMAGKEVATFAVKVVSVEGPFGRVGEDDHAKVLVDPDDLRCVDLGLGLDKGTEVLGKDDATIRERHDGVLLDDKLEDRDDFSWGFVGFINEKDVAISDGVDHGRVFRNEHSFLEDVLGGQGLDCDVSVELDVLAGEIEALEEAITDLVLSHTLVSHE